MHILQWHGKPPGCRSFLRIAHGYLLGLMHRGDGKAAKVLAKLRFAPPPRASRC